MVKNELCFRLTKMADIVYVSIISFGIVFLAAIFSDKLFGNLNKEELDQKKEKDPYFGFYLSLLLVVIVSYNGIINYILRNLIEIVPSPLNGICGLRHSQISELRSISNTIFLLLFAYQYDLFVYCRNYYMSLI